MCLETITNEKPAKEGKGYKIVLDRGGKLFHCVGPNKPKPFPVGEWINEKDFRPKGYRSKTLKISMPRGEYSAGFHIFKYKADAETLARTMSSKDAKTKVKVIEVKYRKSIVEGDQIIGQKWEQRECDDNTTTAGAGINTTNDDSTWTNCSTTAVWMEVVYLFGNTIVAKEMMIPA